MKQNSKFEQSGRSLIEMIAVLAIAAVMVAGTYAAYNVVASRQARMMTTEELRDIAKNAKILFAGRNDFDGLSVPYMIKMGALKTDAAPRIAQRFDLVATTDGGFWIDLFNVSFSNCAWASLQHFEFASDVIVNDMSSGHPADHCTDGNNNKVSILVM
jgi:prepilin-type N-terminal cleavage/methylation domain-containing protein